MKPIVLENEKTIPVSEVGSSKVAGIPKAVDSDSWGDALVTIAQSVARRSKGSGRVITDPVRPKLNAIENKSMSERLAHFGIEEE